MDNKLKSKIIALIKEKMIINQNKYNARNYYYKKLQSDDLFYGEKNIDTYGKGKIKTIKKKNQVFVYTNYLKTLVDQKIDYLLARKPTTDKLPEQFNIQEILEDASLNSSLDVTAWLYLYLNNESNLDWCFVSDSEIIPIYDKFNKYIVELIRFKIQKDKSIFVEFWTKENITTFIIDKNKKEEFEIQESTVTETKHYTVSTVYGNEEAEKELRSFGFIPFIPCNNNKSETSDLENIEVLIYYYNQISSGFIDNIFKFQEFILVLEGFGGQDLEKLIEELKKHKAMDLPRDTKAGYLSVDIPVEARSVILDILKRNIFLIGRGVDIEKLGEAAGNITNVFIKVKYSHLETKANDHEKQLRKFYIKLKTAINKFYNLNIDETIEFNRTMLFNESEKIKDCVMSETLVESGYMSKETLQHNIPYITNVDIENKQIAKEKGLD